MTIVYKTGDLFKDDAVCKVCTVNCVGVMGKGIALEYKKRYPEMFLAYQKACREGGYAPGKPIFIRNASTRGELICNLPTKQHWMNPSKLEWVEDGLRHLANMSTALKLTSVAMTIPGTGNGGLSQKDVIPLMEKYLQPVACEFRVYGKVI